MCLKQRHIFTFPFLAPHNIRDYFFACMVLWHTFVQTWRCWIASGSFFKHYIAPKSFSRFHCRRIFIYILFFVLIWWCNKATSFEGVSFHFQLHDNLSSSLASSSRSRMWTFVNNFLSLSIKRGICMLFNSDSQQFTASWCQIFWTHSKEMKIVWKVSWCAKEITEGKSRRRKFFSNFPLFRLRRRV